MRNDSTDQPKKNDNKATMAVEHARKQCQAITYFQAPTTRQPRSKGDVKKEKNAAGTNKVANAPALLQVAPNTNG